MSDASLQTRKIGTQTYQLADRLSKVYTKYTDTPWHTTEHEIPLESQETAPPTRRQASVLLTKKSSQGPSPTPPTGSRLHKQEEL